MPTVADGSSKTTKENVIGHAWSRDNRSDRAALAAQTRNAWIVKVVDAMRPDNESLGNAYDLMIAAQTALSSAKPENKDQATSKANKASKAFSALFDALKLDAPDNVKSAELDAMRPDRLTMTAVYYGTNQTGLTMVWEHEGDLWDLKSQTIAGKVVDYRGERLYGHAHAIARKVIQHDGLPYAGWKGDRTDPVAIMLSGGTRSSYLFAIKRNDGTYWPAPRPTGETSWLWAVDGESMTFSSKEESVARQNLTSRIDSDLANYKTEQEKIAVAYPIIKDQVVANIQAKQDYHDKWSLALTQPGKEIVTENIGNLLIDNVGCYGDSQTRAEILRTLRECYRNVQSK